MAQTLNSKRSNYDLEKRTLRFARRINQEKGTLIKGATELMKIFGSILEKSK